MKKETPGYLGLHTTIGYLTASEWGFIPYLKDNGGALPPLVIAVGDARRAARAKEILGLKDTVALHEKGEELIGLQGRGRNDIYIGKYSHNNRSVPIVIVETQMGMPATEIIMREVLAHCSLRYNMGEDLGKIDSDAIYVIRVGTAGGINDPDKGDKIKVGDIVNATFNIGWSGTLIESMSGLDYSSDKILAAFKKKWMESGGSFTKDNRFPQASCSADLVGSIDWAAKELGIKSVQGGNFSKDSLYAELDDNAFIELRKKYNIMSTEMEQMAIHKVAADFKDLEILVKTGLVSGIVGVLPGESFSTNLSLKETQEKTEEYSLKVAACALWKSIYKGEK